MYKMWALKQGPFQGLGGLRRDRKIKSVCFLDDPAIFHYIGWRCAGKKNYELTRVWGNSPEKEFEVGGEVVCWETHGV